MYLATSVISEKITHSLVMITVGGVLALYPVLAYGRRRFRLMGSASNNRMMGLALLDGIGIYGGIWFGIFFVAMLLSGPCTFVRADKSPAIFFCLFTFPLLFHRLFCRKCPLAIAYIIGIVFMPPVLLAPASSYSSTHCVDLSNLTDTRSDKYFRCLADCDMRWGGNLTRP